MIYVIFVLLIFIVCLFIKSPKNKYTYFFALSAASIVGMVIISITLWKYDYPNLLIFKPDYKLMLKISTSKYLKYYGRKDIFNPIMIVYMLSLQFFDYDLDRSRGKKSIFKIMLFAAFSAAYLWFFSSETALNIYISLNSGSGGEAVKQVISTVNTMFIVVQTFYILYPTAKLFWWARREDFWPKQRQMLLFGVYNLTTSIFVICFFVFGPLKNNYIGLSTSNLLGVHDLFRINTYHYVSIVTVLCVFIFCILYIIFKQKMLFAFASLRRNIFKKNWNIDLDTREIFHMLKNVMFGIEAIAKQGLLEDEVEEKNERFNQISSLCEKKINDFFEITKISKRVDYSIKSVRVNQIIEEALKSCTLPNDIRLNYRYMSEDDVIYGDFVSLTEAVVNILKNSVEAFEGEEQSKKEITVTVRSDSDMVAIDIEDNGKGIEKKQLKNIFKTFYTTKSRKNNWGIGLGFVYKTVLAHCGHIRINSTKGKGTCVSIILYKEGAYKLWKK